MACSVDLDEACSVAREDPLAHVCEIDIRVLLRWHRAVRVVTGGDDDRCPCSIMRICPLKEIGKREPLGDCHMGACAHPDPRGLFVRARGSLEQDRARVACVLRLYEDAQQTVRNAGLQDFSNKGVE